MAIVAYVEAVEGDVGTALRFVVEELPVAVLLVADAKKMVSLGYVRGCDPEASG